MRTTIKKDILLFGIPALVVFVSGLITCSRDGYDGLVKTLWKVIRSPDSWHQLSSWNILGLALGLVGISIAVWAILMLQRFYTSTLLVRKDHQLITHGPYRIVRHPIYFGVLTAILAVPVYATSLRGLLVLSLLIPIFLLRIRMEEDMLIVYFGDQYRRYQASTKKLIPLLY